MIINDEIPRWLKDKKERKQQQEKKKRSYQRKIAFIIAFVILVVVFFISRIEGKAVTYIAPEVEASEIKREIISAVITAYTSSVDETDDRPWETASGGIAGDGSVACPEWLDFGTHILIQEKEYTCDDRMNARYRTSNHFDVWRETKQEAYLWGRQLLAVEVL